MKLLRNLSVGIIMLTAATLAVAQTVYKIESVNSGKVLDVAGYSTDDGASIHQWTYNGTTNQQWNLEDTGGGTFLIRNVGSGKVLDIVDSSYDMGAYVTQMSDSGSYSQQWYIDDLGDGTKIITNANSGMLLDVEGISMDDGALVHQWENWGGPNQQWRLISVVTNHPPVPAISVEGLTPGGNITGSTITIRCSATDADANLSGIRYNVWNSTTGYFDNGESFIAQSGSSGEVVKTFKLDTPGDWYVWMNAQDASGNYASTGDWTQGVKVHVADSIEVAEAFLVPYNDGLKPLYRLRSTFNSDWLFTTDANERDNAINNGYYCEGIDCSVPTIAAPGTTKMHRYFQVKTGMHYYTSDYGLLGGGAGSYAYEGVAFYVYNSAVARQGIVPLHRYFHYGAGGSYLTVDYSFLQGGSGYWVGDSLPGYAYPIVNNPATSRTSHRIDEYTPSGGGRGFRMFALFDGGAAYEVENFVNVNPLATIALNDIQHLGNYVVWVRVETILQTGGDAVQFRYYRRAAFNEATRMWSNEITGKRKFVRTDGKPFIEVPW